MIRLGTLFSGIGAIEQALIRLNQEHKIIFACDNGDVELKFFDKVKLSQYETLKKRAKKSDFTPLEAQALEEMSKAEESMLTSIKEEMFSKQTKNEKRAFIESIYQKYGKGKNYVRSSYLANYDIDEEDFHLDVRFFDGRDYRDSIDLLVGGSPCQSFSTVGAQKGFEDTRGTLFYEFARIINEVRPRVFIYENVQGLTTNDKGRTLATIKRVFTRDLGYRIFPEQVLNAADYGIPQTRRRLYIVGFRDDIECGDFVYPSPVKLAYTMQDFLENHCADGCFNFNPNTGDLIVEKHPGAPNPRFNLTPGVQKYVLTPGTKTFKTSIKTDLPIARTLLKTMTQHHRAGVDNYITVHQEPLLLRALSDREALRLMGFPDSFKIVVPPMYIYRQAGNSIVVDVLMGIMRQIFKTGVFDIKELS